MSQAGGPGPGAAGESDAAYSSPSTALPELGPLRYEQLVELLEDLTRRMASGEVGIEEAARLYEQAGAVHRAARERLAAVSARLEAFSAADLGGQTAPPAEST
ncbi:MAG: exodeoxyribonuclease VII small subunit [Acidimicrobiales bacterium]